MPRDRPKIECCPDAGPYFWLLIALVYNQPLAIPGRYFHERFGDSKCEFLKI